MNFILFDTNWDDLLPLTFTRPVSELRVGILTIKEKWEKYLELKISNLTQDYLSEKYPLITGDLNVFINSSICPDEILREEILQLKAKQALVQGEIPIAICLDEIAQEFKGEIDDSYAVIETKSEDFTKINYPWDIFSLNGKELEKDFEFLTNGRKSQPISSTNNILGNRIFLEEGAKVEFATLNANEGAIYIGKDAEIMEGSLVRGPFALCEHSTLKLGTKIYGATTIGPHSKAGGEINNSVFQAYSNKGHDGFLGNAVLGEWCNIGADSNNSNLKNNYAEVKMWNYPNKRFIKTGLQFCGLIMGDHSKCGINTMFNTGTVVGVSANIYGAGFPRNFIPSFSWGGPLGITEYKLDKVFEVAEKVFSRRDIPFDETEQSILQKVFEITQEFRR